MERGSLKVVVLHPSIGPKLGSPLARIPQVWPILGPYGTQTRPILVHLSYGQSSLYEASKPFNKAPHMPPT